MAVRRASCGEKGTTHQFAHQRGSGEAQVLFVRVKSDCFLNLLIFMKQSLPLGYASELICRKSAQCTVKAD